MKLKFSLGLACLAILGFALSTPINTQASAECTYTYTLTVTNNQADEAGTTYVIKPRAVLDFADGDIGAYVFRLDDPENTSGLEYGETGVAVVTRTTDVEFLGYRHTYYDANPNIVIDESFTNSCDLPDATATPPAEQTPDPVATATPQPTQPADDIIKNPDPKPTQPPILPPDGQEPLQTPDPGDFVSIDPDLIARESGLIPLPRHLGTIVVVGNSLRVWIGGHLPGLELTASFLSTLPEKPDVNTEYASGYSLSGPITFYVLATGEYQLNFGPDFEGKVYVVVFDRSFKLTNRYEFRAQ
jgi:hypothetical protein